MKKSILILILAGLLTACGAEESEPAINVENTTSAVSETEFSTNPTTEITTKTTVTTITTAVTTTQTTTITTASVETTISTEKKKSTTTAKKNAEEKTASEAYEEIDEYKPTEAEYQNNESHEAEPQMQEIIPPATEPPTEPPAEPPESSGISQAEINSYIIQSAANYGMAGASVTGGDIWGGGYSFNSPINTAVNDSVYAIESYADSELSIIYSECLNSGMTSEEIAQYLYVYVCWDGEWLYIMW